MVEKRKIDGEDGLNGKEGKTRRGKVKEKEGLE